MLPAVLWIARTPVPGAAMGPDNKQIYVNDVCDCPEKIVFYELHVTSSNQRLWECVRRLHFIAWMISFTNFQLLSIAKKNIFIWTTEVLMTDALVNDNSPKRHNASLPNKVAIQCKCSGVYFSSRCRPLWSWTEYIGSVWNLRQPTDMISGSRVLRMRLCQRCFFKRT